MREGPRNSAFDERLGLIVEGARQIDLLVDGLSAIPWRSRRTRLPSTPYPPDVLLRSVLMKLNKELRECGVEKCRTTICRE